VVCALLVSGLADGATAADRLAAGFTDPPDSARPGAWWHWMNGNITAAGIEEDLAWMHRIGLRRVQNFDAALATPQIVDRRLVYMSPEWKDAFRLAVRRADALGLEFGVASSAGWSETGGPWVAPQDGMKKLVWSETILAGGRRFNAVLPQPPSATGPFQNLRGEPHDGVPDAYYRDALVLAYRLSGETSARPPSPAAVTSNGEPIDPTSIFTGNSGPGLSLPSSTSSGPGFIELIYDKPQTFRSLVAFVSDLPSAAISGALVPRLEASDDGRNWRPVADVSLSRAVPATASFAATTARRFRLVFVHGPRPAPPSVVPAPGVDLAAIGGGLAGRPVGPRLMEFRLSPDARINAFEQKAGFALADDYNALDESAGSDAKGVAPASVIDLTAQVRPDGRLDWTAPAGRWKILRLGYSLTGATNAPATAEATGLEVDKYDGEAVARYLDAYLAKYQGILGQGLVGAHGLRALVTDSTEVGPSNWTPRLIEQFQRLRGYDPRPWLPALTGEIVGSRAQSDGFLYDFRRTLAELAATQHYGTLARVAHAHGLTVYGESLEGSRTKSTLGDDLEMRRFADVPMAALWTYGKGKAPEPSLVADMHGAASTAHLYGRTFVAAESLTSILQPWAYAPSDLQPMIDAEFVNGVNLPMLHSVVHQPVDDKTPGLSLEGYGQFFNRHETWAEMARPWIDYIARTGYLLQQGRNVADVAYFYGEEPPVSLQARNGGLQDLPRRYAFDYVSADALLNELDVRDGDVVSKGGARYRLIFLGRASRQMTLPVLRKLAALVEAGATLVGDAPAASPSLADDPGEFARLVRMLWSGGADTRVGQGRVIAGRDVEAALAAMGVEPDFSYAARQPNADVQFVHRQLDDGDLYFVANRTTSPQQLDARFRVAGKAPEIWRADDGTIAPAGFRTEGDETIAPLDLRAGESVFVVFRQAADKPSRDVAKPAVALLGEIGGPWEVSFQPDRGAPAKTQLARLGSLSEEADPGIKYFSGVATYTKTFTLPKGARPGQALVMDLGRIGDVAEVRVNGKVAGTAWKAPYRVDVGALVHPGENRLEIRVADLWVNRLIGDQQPGARKIAFTTIKTYTPKAPLRPSGLIGPVTLGLVGGGP
jgi:hypothetical protein